MAEILKSWISPERGVFRFTADGRRQVDIALLERSPQPRHGFLALAQYDVLASEGGRWNESAFRSQQKPGEGSPSPE